MSVSPTILLITLAVGVPLMLLALGVLYHAYLFSQQPMETLEQHVAAQLDAGVARQALLALGGDAVDADGALEGLDGELLEVGLEADLGVAGLDAALLEDDLAVGGAAEECAGLDELELLTAAAGEEEESAALGDDEGVALRAGVGLVVEEVLDGLALFGLVPEVEAGGDEAERR